MKNIQQHIQKVMDHAVDMGWERGLQLAVYHHGELIVDAWSGIADHLTGRAVEGTTLFPVFSTTKGIVATLIHMLAECNKLNYDMSICEIWPEFAANGKANCTIRHALNHTSGIPHMPEGLEFADVDDWDLMCAEVAKLTPQWPPGEHMEYHAITFGYILGEVARRVDGRPFPQIMQEDICQPLGITDMFVGIPDEVEPRVAILEEPEFDLSNVVTSGLQAIPAWLWPLHEWMNRSDARRACVPASNGIMTAKAIARHYAALLPGGVDGIELLPQSRIKRATAPLITKDGITHTMSMGYNTGSADSIMGNSSSSFGHGGYGGSIAFADPENHLAVGLANNLYSPKSAIYSIIAELKRSLNIAIA